MPVAPEDCYFASGFNNNKWFVIPVWDMVIVRMAEDRNLEQADKVYGRFLELMRVAINKG